MVTDLEIALHGDVQTRPTQWRCVRSQYDTANHFIVSAGSRKVAMIYEDSDGSRARLFMAAPKLLEAAKSAMNWIGWNHSITGRKIFDQLTAAIAEAEGRAMNDPSLTSPIDPPESGT